MEAGHSSSAVRVGPEGGSAGAARHAGRLRDRLPAAIGYGGPFLLVLYLGLKGGGYDSIVRGEIGVAIWWIVLLGVAVGALPATRMTRAGWIGLALIAALAAWTALGITWSESSERSVAELARVATFAGVLALALMSQGRDAVRRITCGVGAAIAVIGALALLSRLHPAWFADPATESTLKASAYRLNYPLDYWNGLAALIAIGTPIMLWIATAARTVIARAFAHAAIPALVLAAFYTFSRGGALEIAVAVAVLIGLHPRRLTLVPTLVATGIGSALLVGAGLQRDALEDGVSTADALAQADQMLAMTLVVCAGVGLIGAAIALAAKHGLGPRLRVERRVALGTFAAVALAVLAIGVATGAPGELGDRWQEFKQAAAPGEGEDRFDSASGNGRYRYWTSAIDASDTAPLTGIGGGTYEYWWAQHGEAGGFVRDAHSLYLETLGELGLVGFALVCGLIGWIVGVGVARSLGRGSSERRAAVAAATAGCSAFAIAAAIDWAWELTVLPVAMLLLAAAILGPSAQPHSRRHSRFRRDALSLPKRGGIAVAAALALLAIAIPLAGASELRSSQQKAAAGDLGGALEAARSAASIQPYAASPDLQEAMLREVANQLPAALGPARRATEAEPTNWRTWLVLARIEARAGHPEKALWAFKHARSLNPRSPALR